MGVADGASGVSLKTVWVDPCNFERILYLCSVLFKTSKYFQFRRKSTKSSSVIHDDIKYK